MVVSARNSTPKATNAKAIAFAWPGPARRVDHASSGKGCTSLSLQWPSPMRNGKSNKNRLRVCRMVNVPLREVSGICLGRGRNGRLLLIAVGDQAAKIAWFSQPRSDEGRIDWHTRNLAKLSGSMLPQA